MRLLLVDYFEEIAHWKSARAVKAVSASDDFMKSDGAAFLMPPGIVLECAFQAAAWLLVISSGATIRPAILHVSQVRWYRPVYAGDRLESAVEVTQHTSDTAEVSGACFVNGQRVLDSGPCICALLPIGDVDWPGTTEWMIEHLTRKLTSDAELS